jgi:type IV pilus assembly protein PilE
MMLMTHSQQDKAALAPGSVRARGFTLIELMITVVIAAVLMTIAFPLYQHQIRESRRTDARSALLDLASREERYYATNNAYTTSAGNLGYTGWPETVGGGYYQIATPTNVNAGTATQAATFTLTATPIAGKGQDGDTDCQSFTVIQTGQESSTNSASADSSATCWK